MIITPLAEERDAVLARLSGYCKLPPSREDIRVYYAAEVPVCFSDGSRHLQMPYGDQALFLKTETFHTIGGFPDLPIMDDFELVRRLRRLGRIAILRSPVATSARRWQAIGPWRTMWINQKVIAGYYLGVPPDRLAQWYMADRDGSFS